jgi:hypothetical protein
MLRFTRFLLLPLLAAAVLWTGCDTTSDEESSGIVVLAGQVLNTQTNNPVGGAFVRILPMDLLYEADSNGRYSIEVEIDSTMDLQVLASADGYSSTSVTVLALAGRTIQVPTLRIQQLVDGVTESGRAWSILLEGQSSGTIGVRESGSTEVANLTFTVVDSVGRPVVVDQSAQVHFSFGAQPGGGESLAPLSAWTDNNGVVSVTLSSGTLAGVVQVMAETTVGTRVIRSQPVAVAIHGGLPDQDHFSVGPARFNFPGLIAYGLTNQVSVIVGDQYSNPVRPGTSVYFSTTHGVIGGSLQTSASGQGSVTLTSANPLPADGIGLVTATTADMDQNDVVGYTPVIFSGLPVLTLTPGTLALGQTYLLTVTDYNGNPLVAGTSISVRVEGTAVKGVGTTNVTLDDSAFLGGYDYQHVVRGAGITEFTFAAVADVDPDAANPEEPVLEAITISVSGANGRVEFVLTAGTAGKSAVDGVVLNTEGAEARTLPDGRLEVRLTEANR